MIDYVVALQKATGVVVGAWPGTRFRIYEPSVGVIQLKIAAAKDRQDAVVRAQAVFAQFKMGDGK